MTPCKICVVVLVLFSVLGDGAAQVAVANHGVNLRPTHSSHRPPIRAIVTGDTLTLLSPDTTSGYLHVRTLDDQN